MQGVDDVRRSYGLIGLATGRDGHRAMDGNNGGWAVLYGSTPVTPSTLQLAIDEDQVGDADRVHITEQVAYLVFEPSLP